MNDRLFSVHAGQLRGGVICGVVTMNVNSTSFIMVISKNIRYTYQKGGPCDTSISSVCNKYV